jgi:hypothetical protein
MISVENFYWILYENLLKPVNLPVRYYYPFGTTNILVKCEYDQMPWHPDDSSAVLFHFDQEPIYQSDDPALIKGLRGNQFKWPRILANSEISDIKKKACKDHVLLDWYYFYHGFAAMNWYRDSRYIKTSAPIIKKFCSLNHLVTGSRSYRMSMAARLDQRGVIDQGMISFHGDRQDCLNELQNTNTYLTDAEKEIISAWIERDSSPRRWIDRQDVNGDLSAHFGVHEYRMWQQSFLHVVNESIFYHRKLHLTEKIFQPIVCLRPFVLVGAPGNLAYLKSYGFKTFDRWIDETYDLVDDDSYRMDMISAQIEKVCSQSLDQLNDMLADMQEVLQHNQKHFFGRFREIIVDELVDNFDKCLRLWNNGRIDRVWPRHPDLQSVKNLLCQI